MEQRLARLIMAMTEYDHDDAPRIQHFMKVHNYAATIGTIEHLDSPVLAVLEAAGVVHDIGIHPSEAKYGNSHGKHQEELGPAEARQLLSTVGEYTEEETERICFLVGHHHTYAGINAPDWQILVEADFLVNIFEDNISHSAALHAYEKIFKTAAGKAIFMAQYGGNPYKAAKNDDI